MTTDRARNIGAAFNGRGRKTTQTPTSTPDYMPYTEPENVREIPQDATPDTPPQPMPSLTPVIAADGTPAKTREATPAVGRQPAEGDGAAEELTVSNVAVYLPAGVLDRLKATRGRRKRSYTDLLIDAFDELSEDQLLQAFGGQPSAGGMPRGRRGRSASLRGQGGIQVQLRLDKLQTAWLDQRVTELGAASRSALVAAVYDMWLPKR